MSWLELFYDLVYVATIIQLGNKLASDLSVTGVLRFALLFVIVWWAWSSTMLYFNRFSCDDVWHRLLVFLQMFAVGAMAVYVRDAFGAFSIRFVLAFVAVQIITMLLYARTWRSAPEAHPTIARFLKFFAFGVALWIVSLAVPSPWRALLWGLAFLVELSEALLEESIRLGDAIPPDHPHLAERYALLTIIVLGEFFVKAVSGLSGVMEQAGRIFPATAVFSVVALMVAASLWWVYFDDIAGKTVVHRTRAHISWLYAHLPLHLGITVVAVGLQKMLTLGFSDPFPLRYAWVICGALVLCMLSVAIIDSVTKGPDVHLRRRVRIGLRVGLSVFLLGLLRYGPGAPTVVVVGLIALACVGHIAIELLLEWHWYKTHQVPLPRRRWRGHDAKRAG